ncbi:hypothetical protein O4H49_19750 [Kiloniella laminariae]|uniref:Uncharacterized protein n=1 Tax=Kiloniella laminariae TaxID=454162 RepID=A0ABT4LPG6_9PROT|nr:hypothetical protein [Kiloniella laminariae]MCZ4283028.1 hypothetical protein [Kiloniella laminariae]
MKADFARHPAIHKMPDLSGNSASATRLKGTPQTDVRPDGAPRPSVS